MKLIYQSTLAPWVSPLTTLLCLVAFTCFGEQAWVGEYFWTVEWIEGSLVPAIASIAIAVAIDTHLTFDPRRNNLIAYADLRGRTIRRYALATALPFVLLTIVCAAYWVTYWPHWWFRQAELAYAHLAVSLLSALALFVLVALVALAASPLGYVVGSIAGLALVWSMMEGGGFLLLGTSTGPLYLYEPVPGTLLTSGVFALLVISCGSWFVLRWRQQRAARIAVAVVTLATVASVALQLPEDQPVKEYDSAHMAYEDWSLKVTGQHMWLIYPLQNQYLQLRAAAQEHGVDDVVPLMLSTDPRALGPRSHLWSPHIEDLVRNEKTEIMDSFIEAVIYPAHCSATSNPTPPGERFLQLLTQSDAAVRTMLNPERSDAERRAAAATYRDAAVSLDACDF